MTTYATLPIEAVRAGPCVREIDFVGLDLTSWTLAAEIRLGPDTPGAPLIALGMVAAGAEGLRVVSVTNNPAGQPVSRVELRIAEATLLDNTKVPYFGELGDASVLSYGLVGTPNGGDKRQLAAGRFVALPTTVGATNAPANRPASLGGGGAWSTWSYAQLTFGTDAVQVNIDGADLLPSLVTRATAPYLIALPALRLLLDQAITFPGFYRNGSLNPALKAGMARVLGGYGRAKLFWSGDSTSAGQWGNANGVNGIGGSRPFRPAQILAQLYSSAGIPMLDGGFTGTAGVQASYNLYANPFTGTDVYDARVSYANATLGADQHFPGGGIDYLNAGGSLSYHVDGIDTFVVTAATTQNQPATVTIDGAAPAAGGSTLNLAPTDGLVSQVYTAASAGTHTLTVTAANGANMIGVRAYNSKVAAWDIVLAASCGATSGNQTASNGTYYNLEFLKHEAPDLTVINLGINDQLQGVTVADYINNLTAIINAAKLTSDVLLVFPHPISPANATTYSQAAYHAAAKQLAATMGITFLSLYEHFGSGTDSNFPAQLKDGVHPLAPLYAIIAALIKQAIDLLLL